MQNCTEYRSDPQAASQFVIHFFSEFSIDLAPPKSVFFDDSIGTLSVRATPTDLDKIAEILVLWTTTNSRQSRHTKNF